MFVYGDAVIYGNTRLSGRLVIQGNANISSNDCIFYSSASGNFLGRKITGTLSVYKTSTGSLEVSFDEDVMSVYDFLNMSRRIFNERTHKEHELLIEVAKSRILYKD